MDPFPTPRLAAAQDGVFTRTQAYDDGWSRRQVRRRLAAGRWLVVAGDAICDRQTEVGPRQLAQALVLTWPGAVVSHQLAGVLHGFPESSTAGGVSATATVVHGHGLQAQGLHVHQLRLGPWDRTDMAGIPVTTVSRTSADLLAELDWDRARSLLAWLLTRQRFALDDLTAAIERRRCWTGTAQLRRLAEVSTSGSLSEAEDRMHDVLRDARITGWVANAPLMLAGVSVVVDLLFAAERVVVEVDGYRTHSSLEAFQQDRVRQNRLVAAGYTVLRFTWADIVERPHYVVAAIRAALLRIGA